MNKFFGHSADAAKKRLEQKERWNKSELATNDAYLTMKRGKPKLGFKDSYVVFHSAISTGDQEEASRLLEEGYDINCVDADGLTALHHSCIDGKPKMVRFLLDRGADVNVADYEGWVPLHAACYCAAEDIVEMLLHANANPALVNNEGETPLDMTSSEDEEILELLQNEIKKKGIDLDEMKGVERKLLMEAAMTLKEFPNHQPILTHHLATPMHVAAAKEYMDVLKVLVDYRKDLIDQVDKDGWSPLHAAVYWSKYEAAKLLVRNGADMACATNRGETVVELVDEDHSLDFEELKKVAETAQGALDNRMQQRLLHGSSSESKPSPFPGKRRMSRELSRESLKMDMRNERRTLDNAPNIAEEESEGSQHTKGKMSSNVRPPAMSKEDLGDLISGGDSSEGAKERGVEGKKDVVMEKTSGRGGTGEEAHPVAAKGDIPASAGDTPKEREEIGKSLPLYQDRASPKPVRRAGSLNRVQPANGDKTKEELGAFRPRSSPVLTRERRGTGNSAVGTLIRQLENKIVATGDTVLPRPAPDLYVPNRTVSASEGRRYSIPTKPVGQKPATSPQGDSSSSGNSSPSASPNFQLKRKVSARSKISNTLGQVMRRSSVSSVSSNGTESNSEKKEALPGSEAGSSKKQELQPQSSSELEPPKKLEPDSTKSLSSATGDNDSVFMPAAQKPTPRSATVSTPGATPPASLDLDTPKLVRSSTTSTPSTSEMGSIPRTDSEVHRKKVAKKERKQRKVTQGVSQEAFKMIMEGDLTAEEEAEMLKSGESAGESPMVTRRDVSLRSSALANGTTPSHAGSENTSKMQKKGDTAKETHEPADVPSTPTAEASMSASKPKDGFVMSAFKPLTRPASKVLIDAPQDDEQGLLWNTPEMDRRMNKTDAQPTAQEHPDKGREQEEKKAEAELSKKKPDIKLDSSMEGLSPQDRARVKSVARRRKKQERRSTGINFSDDSEHLSDDEALPPELKEILKKEKRKKKEAEEETEEGSYPQTTLERRKKVQERKSLLSPRPNRRGEQPAGPSQAMATPKDEKEEVKRLIARVEELEAALQEQAAKYHKLEQKHAEVNCKYEESCKKNDHAKKLNAELLRRCEDTSRAYDQERKESIKCKALCDSLHESVKDMEALQVDNQRLKDENTALIRVIAKMSRSPGINS